MSKKANKTIIGAFVVGAVALAVIGVMVFGSGKFLTKRYNYVLFFKGSVKGLNIGAPVMFRGVKVGSVLDISLRFDPEDESVRIPVTIEIEPQRFMQSEMTERMRYGQYYKVLIEKGLKAQLQLQSIVTGQLMVNLDFYPEKPTQFVGQDTRYLEIPTITSGLEELTEKLEDLPLDVLFSKLLETVEGIEKIVNSPDVMESVANLNQALKDVQHLVRNIDRQVEPLVTNIERTSDAARSALVQAEKTLAMEEGVPGELAFGMKQTLSATRDALSEAEKSLQSAKDVIADDSPLVYQLNRTLEDLSSAARSLRMLTDYLGRQPESLIKGKERQKGVSQ
jgi:paraquat-inducible protein B